MPKCYQPWSPVVSSSFTISIHAQYSTRRPAGGPPWRICRLQRWTIAKFPILSQDMQYVISGMATVSPLRISTANCRPHYERYFLTTETKQDLGVVHHDDWNINPHQGQLTTSTSTSELQPVLLICWSLKETHMVDIAVYRQWQCCRGLKIGRWLGDTAERVSRGRAHIVCFCQSILYWFNYKRRNNNTGDIC